MLPYSTQPKTEILYQLFSGDTYKTTKSYVLPNSKFVADPLYQNPKPVFVAEYKPEEKPFILSGPEYN